MVMCLCAAHLFWIGLRSLWEAFKRPTRQPLTKPAKRERTLMRAFVEGFLTNALNPKVSMFYLAAFPQFISVGENSAAASFRLVTVHARINALGF